MEEQLIGRRLDNNRPRLPDETARGTQENGRTLSQASVLVTVLEHCSCRCRLEYRDDHLSTAVFVMFLAEK